MLYLPNWINDIKIYNQIIMQPQVVQSARKQEKPKSKRRIKRRKIQAIKNLNQEINDPEYQWDVDDVFTVEKIIGQSLWDGKKYFLIKWKGFDISMSTWEEEEKFQNMKDMIVQFKRSKKGKRDRSIQQKSNAMMNPYRATQIHGHFLYGDKAKKIVNTIVQFDNDGKKTIYLQIQWQNRQTNEGYQILQNSILDSDLVFDHNPMLVLNYYQNSVQLMPQD